MCTASRRGKKRWMLFSEILEQRPQSEILADHYRGSAEGYRSNARTLLQQAFSVTGSPEEATTVSLQPKAALGQRSVVTCVAKGSDARSPAPPKTMHQSKTGGAPATTTSVTTQAAEEAKAAVKRERHRLSMQRLRSAESEASADARREKNAAAMRKRRATQSDKYRQEAEKKQWLQTLHDMQDRVNGDRYAEAYRKARKQEQRKQHVLSLESWIQKRFVAPEEVPYWRMIIDTFNAGEHAVTPKEWQKVLSAIDTEFAGYD